MSDLSTPSKVCKRCGTEKPLSDFNKDRSTRDGHRGTCRECAKLNNKRYYDENVEEIRDKSKAHRKRYYAQNSDKVRATNKAWRDDNRDTVHTYKSRKYHEGKGTWEHFVHTHWRSINQRTINGFAPNHDHAPNLYFLDKGVRVEMTYAEFKEWCRPQANVIEQMYRDAEEDGNQKLRPSVDRLDPDGHYSIDNIRIITWQDNSRLGNLGSRKAKE